MKLTKNQLKLDFGIGNRKIFNFKNSVQRQRHWNNPITEIGEKSSRDDRRDERKYFDERKVRQNRFYGSLHLTNNLNFRIIILFTNDESY